ncbi:MAG: hypothetical protein K0S41_3656 [Anaerocolumna sp.]|jgi:hypothetical protein|nr:hypothetical protein [Anaerocolumna sp.]
MLISVLTGVFCGVIFIINMEPMEVVEMSTGEVLFSFAVFYIDVFIAMNLQIIIHEAGHLLFGLMTGYRFSSFRVGSFMWIKVDGTIKLRRHSLLGTGGQCLLIPPKMTDEKYPYVLYNLGGCISNMISAFLFAIFSILINDNSVLSTLFMMLSIIGLMIALMNGIPIQLKMINNDGSNLLSINKDKESLRSFWIQLKINSQIALGTRLKDMPDGWFTIPSEESMKNSITASIGVLACNRMMDQMKFNEANQTLEKLLQQNTGIIGLHRNMMMVDRIYCELIAENRPEVLDSMLDKQQKKFMKVMKNHPSVLRTEYVYALLAKKDNAAVTKLKVRFDKISTTYPYSSEILAERDLIVYACGLKKLQENRDSFI